VSFGDVDNPFRTVSGWLKGALHTHTSESDGIQTPADVARAYRELGFHFVVFTDHGKVTRLDPSAPAGRGHADRSGRDIPDGKRGNPEMVTMASGLCSRPAGTPGDFLVLPGIELGLRRLNPDKYWHFIGVDIAEAPASDLGSPVEIHEYLRAKSRFCVLSHPYWSQLTGADLAQFEGLASVEVWNTGCELEVGRGYAEYQWDWCLGAGRRLTGVAVDDSHGLDDIGKGWVMVNAPEVSARAIVGALSRGGFYSSCGPEIRDIRLDERTIRVETSPCRSISFVADTQQGALLLAPDKTGITSGVYEFHGPEKYVRVQCVDAQGRHAWSNPFYPGRP
jgi:hypothetical protein